MKYFQVVKFDKDTMSRGGHKKYEVIATYNDINEAQDKLDEIVCEQKKNGVYLSNKYGIKVIY